MINDGNSDLTFDYQDWILKGDNGKVQAVKQLLESVNVSESYDTFIGYRTPGDGSIFVTDVNFEASTNTFTFTFNDGSTVVAQITSTGEGGSVDLTPYAKTADVNKAISEVEAKIPDTSNFATKDEIPSVEGLATEEYVSTAIAGIEFPIIPEVPTKLSQLENDSDFITSEEVDEKISAIEGGDTPAYDDTEVRNLISAETEARSAADTKLQSDIEAEAQARIEGDANSVKYQEFTYNDQTRKTIQLANYDSISGIGTDGIGYNIAMVSKWDKVDLGAGGLQINLNGSAARPTYNDDKEIALLEDITGEVEVPTKLSQLENDTNFITAMDIPVIEVPERVSQLENDSNFITSEDVPTDLSSFNNDMGYQTESDVNNRIKSMIGAAPEALDTLVEIADALNNDPDFAGTMTTELSKKADKTELDSKADKTEVTKLSTDVDYIGNTLIPQMNTNTANALDGKVDWDSEKKVISLPKDGSIAALQNEDTLEGANLLAQRTYDSGDTYVTEVGSTKNKLTLNATERPQIDIAGGSSEKMAYESDIKYISHIINFPLRTLQDKVYTQEEILAWFSVTEISELKSIMAYGGMFFLEYGIGLGQQLMSYKMPVDYVAFESATQIKLVFVGLNTRNDKPVKYEIVMNLDGTVLDGNCNVQISMEELGADVAVPTKLSELENDTNFITLADVPEVEVPTSLSQLENDADFQTSSNVDARIRNIIGSAPEALDTLNELAAALNNDPDFASTMTTALAGKVDKVEGKGLSTNDYDDAAVAELAKLRTDIDNVGNVIIPEMNTNTANALKAKVDWDAEKKVISLPMDGSISAARNAEATEGGVMIAQRSYDDNATFVTEVGTTKNKLTFNASERPQVDIAGSGSEKIAYESDLTYISHLVNFPLRTLDDKVYTESEILAWFGVETVADLKSIISQGGIQFLRYGISLSYNPHYYKMPIDYIAFETANQIKLVFNGLNTRNDAPVRYTIIMNLDGTIASGNCNVSIKMTDIATSSDIPSLDSINSTLAYLTNRISALEAATTSGVVDASTGQAYESLSAAVSGGASNIIMYKNAADTITVPADGDVTVDGNGKELTGRLVATVGTSGESTSVKFANATVKTDSLSMGVQSQNQESLTPSELTLTLENMTFDGFSTKGTYITNAKKVVIKNCKFINCAAGSDYVIDFNLCAVTGVEIDIENVVFEGTAPTNSLIKVTQRGGDDDYAHDIFTGVHKWTGSEYEDQEGVPAKISKLTIKNITNNTTGDMMADIIIGSSPNTDGPAVGPRTSCGNFDYDIDCGSTAKVLLRYISEEEIVML